MNRSIMLDILGYDHAQIVADRLRTMDEFLAINAEVNRVTNSQDEFSEYIAAHDAMLSDEPHNCATSECADDDGL